IVGIAWPVSLLLLVWLFRREIRKVTRAVEFVIRTRGVSVTKVGIVLPPQAAQPEASDAELGLEGASMAAAVTSPAATSTNTAAVVDRLGEETSRPQEKLTVTEAQRAFYDEAFHEFSHEVDGRVDARLIDIMENRRLSREDAFRYLV